MKPKRIGIFAGTFDPIHNGHIAFAEAALGLGLEKVMFLPEPRSRRKQGVHAFEHRSIMVQLAVADNPKLGTVVIEQGQFTPRETLTVLQERFTGYQVALLFGDDVISHMIDHLADWPHIEELVRAAQLIIAARHHDQPDLRTRLQALQKVTDLNFQYEFVIPGQTDVSSSKIRQAIKTGLKADGLAPSVQEYIRANGLYSPGERIS